MKTPVLLASSLLLIASTSDAAPFDPKSLARFDAGFAKCEQQFDYMRGHADEAYLGLWKLKADDSGRARLAELRKKSAYKSERQVAAKKVDKPSPELEKKLAQQCQATWAQAGVKTPARK